MGQFRKWHSIQLNTSEMAVALSLCGHIAAGVAKPLSGSVQANFSLAYTYQDGSVDMDFFLRIEASDALLGTLLIVCGFMSPILIGPNVSAKRLAKGVSKSPPRASTQAGSA